MKSRIEAFLKAENKTSAQLAEEIGVQPSGISHILSGRNKPSLDFVLKMLEKYTYLSTEWLLFGRGDMYRDPSMNELFNSSGNDTLKDVRTEKQTSREIKGNTTDNDSKDFEKTIRRDSLKIEKVIWFYSDNSFREFIPGEN